MNQSLSQTVVLWPHGMYNYYIFIGLLTMMSQLEEDAVKVRVIFLEMFTLADLHTALTGTLLMPGLLLRALSRGIHTLHWHFIPCIYLFCKDVGVQNLRIHPWLHLPRKHHCLSYLWYYSIFISCHASKTPSKAKRYHRLAVFVTNLSLSCRMQHPSPQEDSEEWV